MTSKLRWERLSPSLMVVLGVSIVLFNLIFKGGFDPFIPLAFFMMALFELLFRRQRRLSSNLLSLIVAVVFTVGIKTYGADFKIIRTNAFEPRVPKDARVVIQKSLWKLKPGDLVVFQRDVDHRSYLGEISALLDKAHYKVTASRDGDVEQVEKRSVKGKVVFILR